MKPFLSNRWVILALRIVIGGLFIYAGATKIGNPQAFADSIATFQLMPPQLINLLALALPPFEIIVGLMLLSKWGLRPAAFAVLVLSFVFALAIIQALGRGLQVDCGCFGSGEPSVLKTWFSLGRDLLLMGAAALVYLASIRGTPSLVHNEG